MFDFDDAVYDWYAADVASAIGGVWESADPWRERRLEEFLGAYADGGGPAVALGDVPRFLRVAQLRSISRS